MLSRTSNIANIDGPLGRPKVVFTGIPCKILIIKLSFCYYAFDFARFFANVVFERCTYYPPVHFAIRHLILPAFGR